MPGLSFLLKKGWHPNTMENQKKLFMAQQEAEERLKREEEAAKEVAKEREMQQYEKMGDISARDPRTSSLQFMYAQPKKKKGDEEEPSAAITIPSQYLGVGEEDDMVRAFRNKYEEKTRRTGGVKDNTNDSQQPISNSGEHIQVPSSDGARVGYRKGNTQNDLAERHPSLKNAPVEGAYVKDITVRHKPFNAPIRDVQCLRCGEWGHQSVDRECPMKDFNPHDWARQKREDPLTFMQNDIHLQKQKLILRHASLPAEMRFGLTGLCQGQDGQNGDMSLLVSSDDEEGGSDPEAEFLDSLSSKEKKLLLMHLEHMEATGEDVSSYSAYSLQQPSESDATDSSSSSSSSSSSEDDNDDRHGKKSRKRRSKKKESSSRRKKKKKRNRDNREQQEYIEEDIDNKRQSSSNILHRTQEDRERRRRRSRSREHDDKNSRHSNRDDQIESRQSRSSNRHKRNRTANHHRSISNDRSSRRERRDDRKGDGKFNSGQSRRS